MNNKVKRLSAALAKRGSMGDSKLASSPRNHSSSKEVGYEERVTKIAKSINDADKGYREAMYRGAAECAVIGHQIACNIDAADNLFQGRLKQHWERRNKKTSEIYRFLIQSAFEDSKKASKVYTATLVMFERKIELEKFVARLKKYGGFEGLRKRDAAEGLQTGSSEGSEVKNSNGREDDTAGVAGTGAQKLVTADINPHHPKITALYSRKFRYKIERLSLNEELRIKAVVWDAKKDKPVIRIISIEKIPNNRTDQKSG